MAGTVTQYQYADFTYVNNANGDLTQVYFSTIASQVGFQDETGKYGDNVQDAIDYILRFYPVANGTYPNMTVGNATTATQVANALTFGSKTYNGSSAQTITASDLGLASALKPQGSIPFANLPTPSASNLGFVWNITDNFTTTSEFLEGAGISYPAGTNVAVVQNGSSYYFDVYGSFIDLSAYQTITDNSLQTTSKTIVGAINEVNSDVTTIQGQISQIIGGETVVGSAETATQLETTRTFSITGDVTASAQNFNGTQNVVLTATLPTQSVTPNTTYTAFQVTSKGIVASAGTSIEIGTGSPSSNLIVNGLFIRLATA